MRRPVTKDRRAKQELVALVAQAEIELRLRTEERDHALQELQLVQQKHRAVDELFRRLSESGIVGIARTDHSGAMLYANDALLKMMGCTVEEVAAGGVRWVQFIPPEGLDTALRALEELWAFGSCKPFELEYQRRDGTRFWGLLAAFLMESENTGVVFVLDTTQLKVAGEALRLSRERLDLVQQSIDLGVWYCDLPFDKLVWNVNCMRHFGLPPDVEVTIDLFYELIHPEDREKTREAIEVSIANHCGYDAEYRTQGPDGKVRWVRALGRAFYDHSGAPRRFDGVTVDITDQKRTLEQLAEADRQKDEFLAMLAHELRNPLASISSAIEILHWIGPAEEQPARLRSVIHRQTQHLAHLVDDLLDAARVKQGKINLWKQPIELRSAVERAVETCRHRLEERFQHLSVEAPSDPICIEADPSRMEQVLCNLLSNAAKYTAEGGRVSIQVQREGEEAVVRVRDTGIGIPTEILPRIFDLFAQGDESLDRSQGGLGIGLTLAKRIVEMHNGSISAQSPGPGQGSEFVVRLPLLVSSTESYLTERQQEESTMKHRVQRRVLVVEDNLDAAECLGELLELWGHDVRVAHDGTAALEAVTHYHPDVILCDIGLPGMDGYQVAGQIRNQLKLRETLLVAVTGYGNPLDHQRSLEAGFDRHLVKPVDAGELEKLIASTLKP